MQNAQTVYIQTIEGLLEDSEIEKAIDALLELDKLTQAGIRMDVIQQSGNFKEAKREYDRNILSYQDYSRVSSKTRFALLDLMKEIPQRIESDAKVRNVAAFQFNIPDDVRLEKIIGQQSNLLKISWLEKALRASKAVCRVVCADGNLGTGFLTQDGFIFTNNHVLPTPEAAKTARLEFNYELDIQGAIKSRVVYQLDTSQFITSPSNQLDFTKVKVIDNPSAPLSQWGYVDFETQLTPIIGDAVTIIQHPKGEDKQIAQRSNDVIGLLNQHLFYTTDTEPGSSGSPVFNNEWKVVAIHHAGKTDAEGGMVINAKGDRKGANRGILFRDIFAFIGGENAGSPPESSPSSGSESVIQPTAGVTEESIKKPQVLHQIPRTMSLNQESKCIIRISYDGKGIELGLKSVDDVVVKDLPRISETMSASLLDPAMESVFMVRTLNSETQIIDKEGFTEWIFYVLPLKAGTFPLVLKVAVIELVNGKEQKKEFIIEETVQIAAQVQASSPVSAPINVKSASTGLPLFVIYYDIADDAAAKALSKHLNILRITNKIKTYSIQEALAGENPMDRAKAEIESCKHILALVSSNLFNSPEWFGLLYETLEANHKSIIPIRLDQTDWSGTGLEKLRSLPTLNRSVSDFPLLDNAYADVVAEIRKLL